MLNNDNKENNESKENSQIDETKVYVMNKKKNRKKKYLKEY